MVYNETLARVELPHLESKRWKKLLILYQSLQNIKDSQTLVSVLKEIYQESDNSGKELYDTQYEATGLKYVATNYSNLPFSGLQIFLDNILTDSERNAFYERTLPYVANLASKLDEYAPADEIAVSFQQKPCIILLDRKFIASVLASGFLCALSKNTATIATRTINFDHLYASFNRAELKDIQAVKLRCILCYFERLASNDLELSGELIFERQVVNKSALPSLADWTKCNAKLCPIIVDHHKKIVDSDSSFLQVDFSDCIIGGGLLGKKHGQELHFFTSPELLVASLFMESMDDNESLVIRGAERFSTLHNQEGAVQLVRDFHDETERDICGNLRRTIASVRLNQDRVQQNKEELVLSLLNKALVGFYNQGTDCELIKMTDIDGMNGCQEEIQINEEDFGHESDVEDGNYGDEEETSVMYIDDDTPDINGNNKICEIGAFCDSLVSLAFKEAEGEIKVKCHVSCIHTENTLGILENLMKKSVHEVFKNSPEKEQKYKENILSSPLTPKCLLPSRDFNYSDSPLVPSTPPSSPTRRNLFPSGNQSPFSCVSPSCGPLSEEVALSTSSFADLLADSLMSCVMLSTSLATSIATIASTPLRITSIAMETLRESPAKRGHQILSSFSSTKSKLGETSLEGEGGSGLVDLSNEVDAGLESNPYFDETSEEENEARRRSLNELALNLFQDFASKLASSIIKSAAGFVCEDRVLGCIDEEHKGDRNNHDDDDRDGSNNSSSNKTDSSDFECDREDNPEKDSQGNSHDGNRANEKNNNTESDSYGDCHSTDSDSEQDSCEGHWGDQDFDKEFEDRFYELDLTDNEETSNNCHPNCVTDMVNRMVKDLLNSAYPEVARELQEKAELYGSEENIPDLKELIDTRENGFSTKLFLDYAKVLATKVLQEGLSNASINFEPDNFDEQSLEMCSEAEEVERENEISYLTDELNQEDGIEILDTNTKGQEDFETEEIESENVEIDGAPFKRMSVSEDNLKEFAHVLSMQLLETSVAIADASILLQDESLSMRPIATGSKSFADHPELEAVIQWVAASAVGCPALVYYTEDDVRLEKFSKLQQTLRQRYCGVRNVMNSILRYIQQDVSSEVKMSNLFEALLKECHRS